MTGDVLRDRWASELRGQFCFAAIAEDVNGDCFGIGEAGGDGVVMIAS